MKHEQAIFTSRRRALPVLVLTAAMQADAFLKDRDAAAKRRDMRSVHRIEAEAREARLAHLRRK
ncbi:MAG: hypothetical protein ACLGIP_18900 [Alphaproteobacteria bacterium]